MLKQIINHYIIDIGLTAMFNNISVNFIKYTKFYDSYSSYINNLVYVSLTNECIKGRNLPHRNITGFLINLSDDVMTIKLSHEYAEMVGWDGCIYLYPDDINYIHEK